MILLFIYYAYIYICVSANKFSARTHRIINNILTYGVSNRPVHRRRGVHNTNYMQLCGCNNTSADVKKNYDNIIERNPQGASMSSRGRSETCFQPRLSLLTVLYRNRIVELCRRDIQPLL